MTDPSPVDGTGEDAGLPDVRDLLANERTLLAWLRTSLGLLAAGVAVLEFATSVDARVAIGVFVLALGALTSIVGLVRYRAADRAIRAGRAHQPGRAPEYLTVAVVAASVLVAAAYIGSTYLT